MSQPLKLDSAGLALKWVGAWTKRMRQEHFTFDPQTRRLKLRQAVRFVKTVMRPGFMQDEYNPEVLAPEQNQKVHGEVKALVKSGAEFSTRAGQRAFDQISSFDLRAMVNGYYRYENLDREFSVDDLKHPEMSLFQGMPAVSVIGAQSFPTFKLTPIDDMDRIIYKAPGFMKGAIEVTRKDRYVDEGGINMIVRASGNKSEIDQRYAFPRIFSEHGLFGYEIEMSNFDPLTALGGMGMSNHVVFAAMMMASILTNSKKDVGQIFAEAAYHENSRLSGLTGFQEIIQALFNGTGILVYAHNYYGGIGRQLLAPGHAQQVEDDMKLILYNRISGDPRRPVNETWSAQAAHPLFKPVYQAMLDVAWRKEALPLLKASATSSEIDMDTIREGYSEHAWLRFLACQDYFGNQGERAFILDQRKAGNAVFPLGEGSNNSTKLYIGDTAGLNRCFPVLDRETAREALTEKGTVTTGQIPYKMLDRSFELSRGFHQIHNGQAVPEPLITIVGG